MPLDGSMDWESPEQVGLFVFRLFCEADDLQGICKPCHSVKTMTETEMRKAYKQKAKDEAKKRLNEEAKKQKKEK